MPLTSDHRREGRQSLQHDECFNHRQVSQLRHALRRPDEQYAINEHGRHHGAVYETDRSDLLGLETRELLEKQRAGRAFAFAPVMDLAERLES